jgi:hypothetical protein
MLKLRFLGDQTETNIVLCVRALTSISFQPLFIIFSAREQETRSLALDGSEKEYTHSVMRVMKHPNAAEA